MIQVFNSKFLKYFIPRSLDVVPKIDEKCYKLTPGDIIQIREDEECTCDVLVLKSSNNDGYLYLQTS